jgi:hypothetical protein
MTTAGVDMNYDVNDPKGMANCVKWVNNVMKSLKDGGTWMVPRSGVQVIMLDYDARKCKVVEGFASDITIKMVLRAGGWLIEGDKY